MVTQWWPAVAASPLPVTPGANGSICSFGPASEEAGAVCTLSTDQARLIEAFRVNLQ